MTLNKNEPELQWISLILRLAFVTLFAVAAFGKFKMGIPATVGYFQKTFQESWLPMGFVTLYAYLIAFIEALITVWLLSGYRLREGWIFTGLVMVSLATGMAITGQYEIAADNYGYTLIACAGLYASRFDRVVISRK